MQVQGFVSLLSFLSLLCYRIFKKLTDSSISIMHFSLPTFLVAAFFTLAAASSATAASSDEFNTEKSLNGKWTLGVPKELKACETYKMPWTGPADTSKSFVVMGVETDSSPIKACDENCMSKTADHGHITLSMTGSALQGNQLVSLQFGDGTTTGTASTDFISILPATKNC
ncbi:hypothetical protein T439DRAFT_176574 [Meredithblackwellia eburnea MCA 4105]